MALTARGLYELLFTLALEERAQALAEGELEAKHGELRTAEVADRIALHLGQVIQRGLSSVPDKQRVAAAATLAEKLLAVIEEELPKTNAGVERLALPARVLRSVGRRMPDGSTEVIPEPLIPLLDTTLLTNARGEPNVGSQLRAEIASADRVDVVMAFVRRTGISPMLEALRRHCADGRPLRVLTTTYTGSTEGRALDQLQELGAQIRVSYQTGLTRLHAKAWLFHRASGFSTAYVGSSNLTHSAQVTGLEWNVRLSGARNASVVEKIEAAFATYWNHVDFEPYERADFKRRAEANSRSPTSIFLSPIELRLEPFQERLLELIALAREQGHHRNLLVSATGTGKTVMAAVDYARLRKELPRARLLFVAHRSEILTQSLATFRHALRDHAFGEEWVGGKRPTAFQHVFASIQSLQAAGLENLEPEHFDVVIIDEFHHAAARSYQALLDHVQPVELLGLTATPERSDGLSVLSFFGERIAAELRLWDAIDQHRLVPFRYHGIHDGTDLREVPWRRGRGYDAAGLSNVFTGNDAWARLVIAQLIEKVDDVQQMCALGFCVSVDHARFMARVFQRAGIAARAIWSDTPDTERADALRDLREHRINILFSVDLFNEGVDVPTVDTLLFLRPTESPTLFLQQLGRGLRRSDDKHLCVVLDFVGQHRREFRLDRRFRALLGGTRRELEAQIEAGFPFLPAGCNIELDRVAREIVLRSVREAVPSKWNGKVEELRQLTKRGDVTLGDYLHETGIELDDLYAGGKSWSDLQEGAGLAVAAAGEHEEVLRRGIGRLLHVDDRVRIDAYREFLRAPRPPKLSTLATRDRRLLRMLVASIADKAVNKTTSFSEGCALLWKHPQVRAELLQLLDVLEQRIAHLPHSLPQHPDVPLQVHASYSRIEILAGFNIGEAAKVSPWQTGVYWVEPAKTDLFAFTLDKTSGAFSPTTRYRDYAISRELIHWESQSVTRQDSATGLRYQRHELEGSSVLLFARLRTDDRAFSFLGPASYVSHEGELPMAVTWRLHYPLPGDLFASYAAAVA